ncbi:MAG TPA: pitrilysin family protein [Longimicrobiales bacterium]|nr:pitrilysin family protein [Longimicrobiales bacterium]
MRDNIIVKRKTNIPLVTIALASLGGTHNEGTARAGLTAFQARVSIKGTRKRSAPGQIAMEAENLGGSVSPSVGSDLFDWEITVPSKHFDRALDLLQDVAYNPSFPEREFEIERKLTLSDLQQTRDDMYRYPLRLCLQQAFKGHAYGSSLADVQEVITDVTREVLSAWHDRQTRAEPWAFVVGDVDPDKASTRIERFLPSKRNRQGVVASCGWSGPSIQVEQRDKAQTALALGFPGPDRNNPDAHALQVLANAVGGLGGRLFEELRSNRSLAYTVSLLPVARWLGGAFVAYIATAPAREDEARAALLEEIDRLRNDLLSSDELERSKRYTIGTWQIRSQTNAAQLSDLMHAHMVGPGPSEITNFEQNINEVSAEHIRTAAQRYFDPAMMVEGIVRGKA